MSADIKSLKNTKYCANSSVNSNIKNNFGISIDNLINFIKDDVLDEIKHRISKENVENFEGDK